MDGWLGMECRMARAGRTRDVDSVAGTGIHKLGRQVQFRNSNPIPYWRGLSEKRTNYSFKPKGKLSYKLAIIRSKFLLRFPHTLQVYMLHVGLSHTLLAIDDPCGTNLHRPGNAATLFSILAIVVQIWRRPTRIDFGLKFNKSKWTQQLATRVCLIGIRVSDLPKNTFNSNLFLEKKTVFFLYKAEVIVPIVW